MAWRPQPLTSQQKENYRRTYTSQYKDDEVNKMIETVNKQQKSILERLQTAGYKDAKARTQLQRDLYDYKYKLSALGALGVDVSEGKKLSEHFDKVASEQDKMFSPFKDESSYLNALYSSKYKGKKASDIDFLIDSMSNSRRFLNQSGNQKELDWLKANRDSFMSRDELLSEIGSLENKSAELKKNKWENRFDYAGNLIGGAFAGDTSRARSYNTTPETDEIENNARLKKLKELLAGRDDFDAESAYKKADEKNLWDVITTDYTYADYLNDKDSKNIYGKEAVRRRDEENNKIIQSNSDEFSADYSKVASIIAGKKQASAVSSSGVGDLLSGFTRDSWRNDEIMKTDPEIRKIIKKWSDKGYDFESLYNSFVKKENADFTEDQRLKQAENTRKNPVLSNITSVGTNVIGGISSLLSVLKTGIEDATSDDIVILDTNAPEWALKNVTDSIRDTTSQMISEKNDGIKREFLNLLYTTGMSIADNVTLKYLTGLNPKVMQVIMGTNAAADGIKSVVESGGSVDEAILTGLTNGIFEALFEKVSIDNLFRTATSDTGKKLIYNFFRGFLSEGSEELCTEIANTFADALINGNNSEFNNSVYNYMAEGKTAAEARSLAMVDTMKQMGLSFAGGALSGGVIAGVGGGVNLLSANRQNAKTGNEIINNGKTDALMDLALKNMHNSEVADNIDAINKYQSRVENKNFRTNGKNEISYAVEHRLADLGVTDSEIANRVTDAYFRGSEYKKTGNKIADKQGATVLSELRSSENATGRENFTNEWAAPVVDKARTDAKTIASEKYRARDIGRLAGSVHNAIIDSTQKNVDAEIKKGIRSRAEELGIDKSTSKTASEIIFNAFMGEKLTMSQNRILQNNPVVNMVYNELKSADEVGIDEEYNNSWVAPVLENTGVMRAEEIAQLSMITPKKGNTVTGDGMIDNNKPTDLNNISTDLNNISTDLNNSSIPKVVNGTVNFDEFVSKTRAEKMNYGVVKKYNKTVIDNKIAGQIAVLDAYGRKHGLSFIVVDSIGEGDTRANGTYVGKNKVLISLDAEAGAMLSVAGHEVYHYIARNNKLSADSIKAFVLDKLKNNANYDYEFEFNKLVKSYGTENVDEIEEEMVANSMFDIISNEDTVNQLSKENPTLLEKIVSYVKNFIDEIKKMAKNLPWKEIHVFEKDTDSLRTIKAMAEAALWNIKEINEHKRIVEQRTGASENTKVNKTRENVKTASAEKSESEENVKEENNTATRDGVIKFSLMNDTSFEDNIDNIIDMTDEDAIRNKEQGNFIRIMHNTPSVILDNIKESENNEVIIRFDALYLATRKDGVLDGHYHNLGKVVMKNLPEYISNPDAIVRMNNGRLNIFATMETNKGNNGIISMEMNTVKDINSKFNKYNLVITVFSAKDNYIKNNLKEFGAEVVYKKEDLSQVNPQLYEWLAIVNDKSSDNSISQDDTPVNTQYMQELNEKYFTAVKTGDMEAAQKLVDKAAERAGYNSPLLYHGTKAFGFTEFDLEKMDDKTSIFLTSNPKIASTYSGVDGKRNISDSSSKNIVDMSTEEIANELNSYPNSEENRYEFYDLRKSNELISEVNNGIEDLTNVVEKKIELYGYRLAEDFNENEYKTHKHLVTLLEKLKKYDYKNLSTPIYMLLHHSDAFDGSAEISKLEKNIRLMNELSKADITAGVIVKESLGGYYLEVLSSEQAREELEDVSAQGNYSMYAKLGKTFFVDCKGSLWNDITYYEDLPDSLKSWYPHGLWRKGTTREVAEYAKSLGYDSVTFKNVRDNGGQNINVDVNELADIYVIFDINAVKSADTITYDDDGEIIPLDKRFDEDNPDIRFSFAGGKAKAANYTRLDEAIRLESEGLSSEEIRQQTGWFRGYDNKWRFEIDDSKMEFSRKGFFTNPDVLRYQELADKFFFGEISDEENSEFQSLKKSLEGVKLRPTTLGDYVKHNELFKAYPELKNLKVTIRSDMPRGYYGSYNSQRKEIILNSLQASDESAIRNTLMHEIQHAIQDIEGFSGGADTYNPDYGRTAGEVESRDVSKRLGYDAEKRKNTRPDIDRTDVVFADTSEKSYEIKIDIDGNKYVEVDPTLFDVRSGESHAQTIARIIKDRFNNLISVNGQDIQINKTTNREWLRSESATYLSAKKPQLYLDKLKTISHADEILKASNNWIGEQVAHERKDDIIEFARGTVLYKVGDNGYIADVLVGIRKSGTAVLYDLKNIYEKEITDISLAMASDDYSQRSEDISVKNSISQQNNDVNIKLSLQETAKAGETREQLIKENANLRVANKLLKSEMQLTKGNVLPYETAKQIAKNLMKEYSSEYNSNDLAMEIYQIFDYYDGTGDYDYVMNYLATIGKRVVARSSAVDRTLYEDYEDLRKWIRNMQFTLPEQVVKQLNENYDGKFVSKTFGRMRYVSRATHPDAPFLSQIYSELANEYPNFFSIEDNEYEQPMRLIEFWEKIQPTVYNPANEMGYASEDEAAVGFAFDVFKAYNNADKHTTFADKKKNEIDKIRKEYDRNLERAKQKLTADRDRRLEWQKEYYINAREKSAEGRRKAYVKKKIRNVIKDLDKYLNRGSKEKNVKEGLQETVQTFLSAAEVLFSDVPTNEDIVRSGVSSFTKKEAEWLDEYASLITKRDELLNKRNEINEMEMSEKFISARDSNNRMLDTVQKRMHYLDKCLDELFEREKIRVEGATVDEALAKLSVAYTGIRNSEYSYISNSFDENVYNQIESLRESLGGAKISLMSLSQLESVYDVYKMVLHTVRNANKVFTSEKKETAEDLGKIAMKQIREAGGNKKRRVQALEFLKKFGWSELKPIYAFRLIGSEVLRERYSAMRQGEDTYYRDVSHAKEFYAKLRDKYKTDEWKLDKGYEFTSKDGEKFTLTLEQIMSIYAYSRRGEQAVTHLVRGGFVFSDAITVEEKKKGQVIKYKVDDGAAYRLNADILGQINHILDDNKRAFVEEMQKYLSDVMGDKGNEVSMKMYGVKLFKEKNYFPLKSSAFYKAFDGKVEGEASLKNAGFSKATTPKANNPIVLDDFTNVWSNHVQDMAMYHSFVLPIEDFTKVFNYESHGAEDSGPVSVTATLQGAYGPFAEQYVRNLLTDLNSGVRSQTGAEFVNKLTGVAKKNAVFASMSVVIQQPSAVVRATAHVNPKYFINAFPQSAKWLKVSKEYEELKKYAPVAGIKEMGYFDTGLGKSTADWITEKEYRGFGKKFKAFVSKDGKYRDEVFSMLAGKADEVSWVYIWNAVKKEVAEKQHLSGEALLTAAGKRFTEVIELTQVYDSVFSRSGLMRSKDSAVKMVTSFMAEPTTQINMLFDAVFVQGKRGNKKYAAAVVGAVYASIFVNALLKAVVTAARDDDEEFSYSEKYISDVISSFLSDGILVSSIPFLRDVVSIFKGYDVERMDMSVISDIVNSIKALESDKKTTFEKAIGIVASLLLPLGIPATNIVKDAKALYNIYSNIINKKDMSWNALSERLNREILLNSTPKAGLLYNAIVSGDTEYAGRLKKGFTESGYNSAVREGLKKYDSRIYDAAVARMNGNTAEYMRLAKEIIAEGNFSQDNIVSAIISTINSLSVTEDKPKEEKTESIFTDEDYFDAVVGGDGKTADIVGKDLVETDVANGKPQEDAEKSLVSSLRNNVRDAFEAGELDFAVSKNILVKYGDMTDGEADNKLRYWDFVIEYPDITLDEEIVIKYYNDIEPSGISVDLYYEYYVNQKACKGEKDSEGKTISGSKKAQILKVIDELPLTSKQKDLLYFQNNWSESTLYDAPWH